MSRFNSFPHYHQLDAKDCGPTCLRMIARFYGKNYSLQTLRERSFITREGVSMLGISDAAESIGFHTSGVRITLKQLKEDMPLPCILHWRQNHFVVCYDIREKRTGWQFRIADPATKLIDYPEEEFAKCWLVAHQNGKDVGTALALAPSAEFYKREGEQENGNKGFRFFLRYLSPYRKQVIQLLLSMLTFSILQLIFPFLTQALVDTGIRNGNLHFITLILISQLMVSVSQIAVEFLRSWIILHMNTRINITLISDFLSKLMKLPLRYFDTKMVGDIMQRIGDHRRIETFLTGSSISTLFSFVNFFIFGGILAYYDLQVLFIFLIGNSLYILWVTAFMRHRRALDIRRFAQASTEQSSLIQMVTAMQEIKLNNCEKQKRWQWERIQVKLFHISVKSLTLGQMQQAGSIFFHQTTNILISFIAAKAVVEGQMTLGMMMSLTYIIGQLNTPVNTFISFAQQLQDAKISLERLNEVRDKKDEEEGIENKLTELPELKNISVEHVSFSYDGAERNYVLDDICLDIPERKVTAIVGASGSGKTTLLKLIMGFYEPNRGKIRLGDTPIESINPHLWRAKYGSVMQEGFIFSDSIAHNIAVGDNQLDKDRLRHAVTIANIRDFIDSLPLGYNTMIGMEGNGISQGQKQRLLIARAVYKNPEFLFFDEATNALDANNEHEIMEHLQQFYLGKTVVIVAHRLSTVKKADKIVVLDKGKVVEEGTHQELTNRKGLYYKLVKNQLEMGN
ncbi:peptidase domain-containing ABC transporter [uncultured Bacteroides sp.]|jgi:ATP-binding cassette subfamily B protein|uniref:peptidase domain-containing ABC transporter n=1 Tax=uncultured Bacteroides sp. TaxID=162156 RepID=UPI0025ECE6DE|nr:peptidase domain-containing ABC transporter [uncultured Bacteroides sp.]